MLGWLGKPSNSTRLLVTVKVHPCDDVEKAVAQYYDVIGSTEIALMIYSYVHQNSSLINIGEHSGIRNTIQRPCQT